MKIVIIGSRTFTDFDLALQVFKKLPIFNQVTCIVSGGAKGADSVAEQLADTFNLPTIIHYPDWDKYCKSAGFVRNKLIIDDAEYVLAFWDLKSKGTLNSIRLATQKGIPVKIQKV